MASLTCNGWKDGDAASVLRPTDRCFYCGEQLAGVLLVYWHGNDERGQEIWLHPACAVRLAAHLAKDGGGQ